MPGLILNLKPWESFIVGEHVLQNGGKRTQLRVRDEKAGVLRLSDALHPDHVRTPMTRAYYTAQLLLLGQMDRTTESELLLTLLRDAQEACGQTIALVDALRFASEGQYYQVLRTLKPLLPAEALLLSCAHEGQHGNQQASEVAPR